MQIFMQAEMCNIDVLSMFVQNKITEQLKEGF